METPEIKKDQKSSLKKEIKKTGKMQYVSCGIIEFKVHMHIKLELYCVQMI